MSRQRIIILALCILLFGLLAAFTIGRVIDFRRNTYRVGAIPQAIVDQLAPKIVPLASMRPPALRASDPMRFGNVTSVISVIEYGDYQCPVCASMDATIQRVVPPYGGRVRVVWRDFPLIDVHQDSMAAAVFARCAGMQGKYWQAHDELLKASSLGESTYAGIQTRLGLDPKFIAACRKTQAIQDAVTKDVGEAQADGIKSVPFLYVGTQAYDGAIDSEALKQAIERALNS